MKYVSNETLLKLHTKQDSHAYNNVNVFKELKRNKQTNLENS